VHCDSDSIQIAVPAVLYVTLQNDVPVNQVISEAVDWVSSGEAVLWRNGGNEEHLGESYDLPVFCRPLVRHDRLRVLPNPDTRSLILARLRDLVDVVCESVSESGVHDPEEIRHAADEVAGILDILILSGPPAEEAKAS